MMSLGLTLPAGVRVTLNWSDVGVWIVVGLMLEVGLRLKQPVGVRAADKVRARVGVAFVDGLMLELRPTSASNPAATAVHPIPISIPTLSTTATQTGKLAASAPKPYPNPSSNPLSPNSHYYHHQKMM